MRDINVRISATDAASGVLQSVRATMGNVARVTEEANRQSMAMATTMAKLGGVVATAFSVRAITQASDDWQTLNSRLSLVSAGAATTAAAYQNVVNIAQATRQGVNEVALVYERFARQANVLGLSQQQLANITTSVSQAMVVSGSSAESSRAALIQLGQGLASGTLRGEELNSIMEQAPRLAQALADGLGVPIGKLRELGAAGELTSAKIVEALQNQAPRIAEEFAKMPVTISGSLTQISNAWTQTIGSFERSTGVFSVVAQGLSGVSEHMGAVVTATGGLAAVMSGRLVSALAGGASGAVRAATENRRLAVEQLAVATTAQAAAANQYKVVAAYGYNAAATKTLADANRALALAQGAVAATGPLATGLSMLGGPIGVITTALTLGATAWAVWGSAASDASDKARNALRSAQEEAARRGMKDTELVRQQFDAAAAKYYENPNDRDARAKWAALGDVLKELEERDRNLSAQTNASAGSALDAWSSSKYATAVENRTKKLAELGKEYAAAMLAAQNLGKSEVERDRLTAEYAARRDEIMASGQHKDSAEKQAEQEARALESLQLQLIAATSKYSEFDQEVYRVTEGSLKNANESYKAARLAIAGQSDEMKRAADETQAYGRALEQHIATMDRETVALEEKAARALYENSIIGVTSEQMAVLVAQRYDEQIAIQQGKLAQARATEGRKADVMYIERQIVALERLKGAEIARPKLQQQAAEWNRFSNQIEQSLTDSLYRAFESGKGFGESFADSLEATFKAMVLKYTVQVIVDEAGSILGISSNSGSGGTSMSSLGNLVNTGTGLYNAYLGYTAGSGTGIMGSIGNWAGGLGGYGGWGASTAATYGTTVGSQQTAMLAAQEAGLSGGSAAGGSSSSGWAGSLGWIAAIAAGMYMSSEAWKEGYRVGDYDPKEKQRTGYDYPISNFFKGAYDTDKAIFGDKFADSQLRAIITGDSLHFKMQEAIFGSRSYKPTGKTVLTGAFGGDTEGGSASQLGQEYKKSGGMFHSSKKKTIWESTADTELDTLLDNIHGAVVDTFSTLAESVGDTGSAAAAKSFVYAFSKRLSGNFEQDIGDLTNGFSEALAKSLIPSFDAMKLDTETSAQAFTRLTIELSAVSQASMLMGKSLTGNLGELVKMSDALIAGFGGMSAFNTAFQSYYEAFYSQNERLARSTQVLDEQFARLGVSMPTTKDGLRAMVEGLDLTTEAGQAMFTQLINLAPAFAEVMDAATAAATKAADEEAAAAAMLAEEIANQQAQIKAAWQDTADSITETIRALRGEVMSPTASYASAQSQFAIAAAMAKAGDADAANRLPELASAVVTLGKSVTATSAEQTILTARTIATLQSTLTTLESQYGIVLPQFASGGMHGGGLRIVGERGPEIEATGPARIYNFDQMREMMSGASMADELRALRAELRRMREDNSAENQAVVGSTGKLVKLFERVMPDGDSLSVRTAA